MPDIKHTPAADQDKRTFRNAIVGMIERAEQGQLVNLDTVGKLETAFKTFLADWEKTLRMLKGRV